MKKENLLFLVILFSFIAIIIVPIFYLSLFDSMEIGNIIAGFFFNLILIYGIWRLINFLAPILAKILLSLVVLAGFISILFIIHCLLINGLSGNLVMKKNYNATIEEGLVITGYKGNNSVVKIPDKILFYPIKTIKADVFKDKNITELQLPKNIEYIGENAFLNNYIKELILPFGIKYIGDKAFQNNNITTIKIPSDVEYIGHFAFYGNEISNLEIGENVNFFDNTFGHYAKASDIHYWERFKNYDNMDPIEKNKYKKGQPYDIIEDYKLIDPGNYYYKYVENGKQKGIFTVNWVNTEKPEIKVIHINPRESLIKINEIPELYLRKLKKENLESIENNTDVKDGQNNDKDTGL